METITITIIIDEAYRRRAEELGMNFKDYLTGVVINHLMKNAGFDQDVRGVKTGALAAIARVKGRESIGWIMRECVEAKP